MSSTLEEADPSEARAVARHAAAIALPNRVTFNRFELNRILDLYGRMVADGEWRDYAIDFMRDRAVFSIFRRFRSSDLPHRERPSPGAQARDLQRDIGDRLDPAPRP